MLKNRIYFLLMVMSLSACVCQPIRTSIPEQKQVAAKSVFREVTSSEEAVSLDEEILLKMPAHPALGFNFPYYLYVSSEAIAAKEFVLLVEPNNTGTSNDDFSLHDSAA